MKMIEGLWRLILIRIRVIHTRMITIGLNMKQIGRHRLTTPLPRILRMTKIIRILKPVRLVSKKKVTSLTIPYMKKIH